MIIMPAKCRGMTAGALQQLKTAGHSDAQGGVFSVDVVRHMAADVKPYFNKNEPTGKFMSDLPKKVQEINDVTEAILASSRNMVQTATDANKRMADISGKTRDGAEKLGAAVDRFMKIATRPDFEQKVKTMEALVSAMERLAVLESNGKLGGVMKILGE